MNRQWTVWKRVKNLVRWAHQPVEFSECPICGALMERTTAQKHQEWHKEGRVAVKDDNNIKIESVIQRLRDRISESDPRFTVCTINHECGTDPWGPCNGLPRPCPGCSNPAPGRHHEPCVYG